MSAQRFHKFEKYLRKVRLKECSLKVYEKQLFEVFFFLTNHFLNKVQKSEEKIKF